MSERGATEPAVADRPPPALTASVESHDERSAPRISRSSWAQEVEAKALKLRDRIPSVHEPAREELTALIHEAIGLSSTSTRLFTWSRFVDWWFGNRVERAWTLLHHAEILIIEKSDTSLLPVLMEEAVGHASVLDQTDPARVRLTKYVSEQSQPIGSQK